MDAAKDLLKRAVELDSAQQYSQALICYEEGIQNLLRSMTGMSDSQQKELRKKIEEYLERAEEVKRQVKAGEDVSEKVQYIHISDGATGYSYVSLFKSCLDGNIEWVEIQDPYIRAKHQIHNFVRFCEMLVAHCGSKLKKIALITGIGDAEQGKNLSELQESLKHHNITLSITYSTTLHDREIQFSNGWIVRIGRGLDYFQRPKGQFCIGFSDYNLRPCHETKVEIYHKLNAKKLKENERSV